MSEICGLFCFIFERDEYRNEVEVLEYTRRIQLPLFSIKFDIPPAREPFLGLSIKISIPKQF